MRSCRTSALHAGRISKDLSGERNLRDRLAHALPTDGDITCFDTLERVRRLDTALRELTKAKKKAVFDCSAPAFLSFYSGFVHSFFYSALYFRSPVECEFRTSGRGHCLPRAYVPKTRLITGAILGEAKRQWLLCSY